MTTSTKVNFWFSLISTQKHCFSTKDPTPHLLLEVSISFSKRSIIKFMEHDDIQIHSIFCSITSCCCSRWSCQSFTSSSPSLGGRRSNSSGISIWPHAIRFHSFKSRSRIVPYFPVLQIYTTTLSWWIITLTSFITYCTWIGNAHKPSFVASKSYNTRIHLFSKQCLHPSTTKKLIIRDKYYT